MSDTNTTVRSSHVTPQLSGQCNPCNRNGKTDRLLTASMPVLNLWPLFHLVRRTVIVVTVQWLAAADLIQQSAARSGSLGYTGTLSQLPDYLLFRYRSSPQPQMPSSIIQRHNPCAVASRRALLASIYLALYKPLSSSLDR